MVTNSDGWPVPSLSEVLDIMQNPRTPVGCCAKTSKLYKGDVAN